MKEVVLAAKVGSNVAAAPCGVVSGTEAWTGDCIAMILLLEGHGAGATVTQ